MEVTTTLLCAAIAIASLVFYIIWDRMNYWKKRGIPHDEPYFFYGNMKGVRETRHLKDVIGDIYTKYKGTGSFCGLYFFFRPAILLLDLQLVKKVLVKDFNNFADSEFFYNEKDDPLSANVAFLDGDKWRTLRNKLTPTFSSGKMKAMFPIVAEVGHRFVQTFGSFVGANGAVVEIKDINARFTTDVIGTCAFGIECNSLKDPNAQFRVFGRKMVTESRHPAAIMNFLQSCPKLGRKLGFKIIPDDIAHFFMNAVTDTVAYREKNQIRRNDLLNILMDLKNNKPIKTEDGQALTGLTMEEVAAQAFVFFLAGFETSSTTLSFALYELALNTDVQDKLRVEVNKVLAKHNGEMTYESITEMQYMSQVFEETLRMYSIGVKLQRVAKEDYDTGDPKYKIPKGSLIFIPSNAIHHDPEIYPNPKKFDPDRFSPEEKQKRESVTWLAFSDGPRNCIGIRFAKMQMQIGLALLIKNFKLSTCEQTIIPVNFDIKQPMQLLAAAHGIFIRAERV